MADVSWATVAPGAIPTELKPLQSQLQRAREIAPVQPVVAYWLLFAAAQEGLRLHPSSPEARSLLLNLVDNLEAAKKSPAIEGSPLLSDNQLAYAHVSKFALSVFARADNQDRGSRADRYVDLIVFLSPSFLPLFTFLSFS